jgi:protein tyrosine phosphatase (PTP) superfamily phosphohydrolase (DUF442 family)
MNNEAQIGSIIVGGQPSADELHRYGTVVNLRLPDEKGNTTARDIAGSGVAYHEEPLTADTMSPEHIKRIIAALDAATGDVLIH